MEPTRVEDDESLYRSIRAASDEYVRGANGTVLFSASSFNDRQKKPSVDRSSLCDDPRNSRRSESDGIAKIITKEVRSICHLRAVPQDPQNQNTYAVDAMHRPIEATEHEPENLAHCQVECAPEITSSSHFRKLKDALALLATTHGFVVEPSEPAAEAQREMMPEIVPISGGDDRRS